MEYWETCVCFCFSYFPCCCYQASPRGRVYGSTSATKKKSILESTFVLWTPRYNGHPGRIRTTAKSQAKINYNIQTFDWNERPLLRTLANEDTNSRSRQCLLKKELTVLTSKKLPQTLIQCEPRQRVNHKAYQYPAVFGEKQEVSDQLPLQNVPSVYASSGGET